MKQNIMQKFLNIIVILLFTASLTTAQGQSNDTTQTALSVNYSESPVYQPRVFTNFKKSKSKKEKIAEKNNPSTNETSNVAASPLGKDGAITIPVSVFDAKGKLLADLKQSDFKIFVDDKEQEILSIAKGEQSMNVILLIDTSPSTAYKIEEIQNYALASVEQLNPNDKVTVLEFNKQIKMLTEPTADRQVIEKAIRKTKFATGTSLYESIKNIFDKYIPLLSGQTAVILLTDGVDTTSRETDYARSLTAVEKMNAAVFTVFFDTFEKFDKATKANKMASQGIFGGDLLYPQIFTGTQSSGATAADYEVGKAYLNDISILSGGRSRSAKDIRVTNAENVSNIGEEIHVQYQVTFRVSDFANGQRKQIRVRVNRSNLRVQARGSLIVGGDNQMQFSNNQEK